MNEMKDDRLTLAAGRLATELTPGRDLWPGIEQAIQAPPRQRWMPAFAQAAAVVLLVGASSAITYIAVKDQQRPPFTPVTTELMFEQTSFGGRYNLGPDFQDARDVLAAQLDDELARLSPESRAEVEKNLALVRQAIADINEALADEPDNALLQGKLLMAYREELSVLRHVGGLTRNVMMRNDI